MDVKYDPKTGCFIVIQSSNARKRLKLGTVGSRSNGIHTVPNEEEGCSATIIVPEVYLINKNLRRFSVCPLIRCAMAVKEAGWTLRRNPLLLPKLWNDVQERLVSEIYLLPNIWNKDASDGDEFKFECRTHILNDPFHQKLYSMPVFIIQPPSLSISRFENPSNWIPVWICPADQVANHHINLMIYRDGGQADNTKNEKVHQNVVAVDNGECIVLIHLAAPMRHNQTNG